MSTSARRLHYTYATSDLRVLGAATGLTTYPDIAVICGPTLRTPAEAGAVLELSSVGARVAVDELYRDGLEDAGR